MRIILGIVAVLFLTIPLNGQIIYPVSIGVGWDKNISTDQVIDYTLVHNNGLANVSFTVLDTACIHPVTIGHCQVTITVPGASAQTVSITARNQWGVSLPEVVTFTVTAPGKARNIKIRAGS